ncbi:MAG: XamI family restriction endonuclease [Muribaculaceae bacterium]|nr:XamI family restriction endonuclease [Muribaculaceae bacterium]
MSTPGANIRQIEKWKTDSWESVEFYNKWFMEFAPIAFQTARKDALKKVMSTLCLTKDFTELTPETILNSPQILSVLRMVTAPPLAQERLAGLSYLSKSFLKSLEKDKLPKSIATTELMDSLTRVLKPIRTMLDKDLFPWLSGKSITPQQRSRSAYIIADRLTGALSDPIIRTEQEKRQLKAIGIYLEAKGYLFIKKVDNFKSMLPRTFSYHVNVPVKLGDSKTVNMPIDVVIRPETISEYPILVECKSAGDFTNTNKRRKEEATKINQLRATYGNDISFCLFLCGYFDTGFLGYEAAEGIDWVWEHRISDFDKLGV